MSELNNSDTRPRRKSTWLRVVFRIFMILLIGIGIGVGLFYGAAYLSQQFIQTVQINTEDIAALTTRMGQLEEQTLGRLDDLAARLDTLELTADAQKLALTDLDGRTASLETSNSEFESRMQSLETMQTDLNDTLEGQHSDLAASLSQTDTLAQDVATAQKDLSALGIQISSLETALQEWNINSSDYDSTLKQIKALVLLSRSQLYISQNNLGLARQDVQSARGIIVLLESSAGEAQAAEYAAVLIRIDSALANLPKTPLTANTEVESAWNALLGMIESGLEVQPGFDTTPEPTPQS